MPIASRSENTPSATRGSHCPDRGPARVYPELPVASEQAHLLGGILPAKNQPVSEVRYLPSAKFAHEPSAIIYPRNRANSIVARARIPLRVMTLPKTLCNASTFRRDASRISTLIKKVLDSCGKCGHSLEIGGVYGAISPTIHSSSGRSESVFDHGI